MTAPLAASILARYDSLEELKQLADDVANERVAKSTDPAAAIGSASLRCRPCSTTWATARSSTGRGTAPTAATDGPPARAVAAFAAKEGLSR